MKRSSLIARTLVFFVIIFATGCGKKQGNLSVPPDNTNTVSVPTDNYIAFGQYYGECRGEFCKEMYRVGNDALFEDTLDRYPKFATPYDGEYKVQDNARYLIVKDFRSNVPDSLFSTTKHVIGQPDAGDWGGLYIEVCENGVRNFWYIDKKKSNVPAYLHSLVDNISTAVEELK